MDINASEAAKEYGAAVFDAFCASCAYAASIEENGGYGCSHPDQEERTEDEKNGCCYCSTCPLGREATAEDVNDPNIDWDENNADPECMEGEYLIVDRGANADPESKAAWERYQKYLRRYERN